MDNKDHKPNRSRKFIGKLLEVLLPAVIISLICFHSIQKKGEEFMTEISYDKLISYIESNQVKEIVERSPYLISKIEENNSTIKVRSLMITNRLGEDKRLMDKISESKIVIRSLDVEKGYPMLYLILSSLPLVLLALSTIIMITRARNIAPSGGLNYQDRVAKKTDVSKLEKVTFKDVAGSEEAKQELAEIVDFLQNPVKYLQLGAKIPKGVLLSGVPGTGKTLLAKAVAGEAKVPFHYMSGAEFVELFVGMGSLKVRELFKKAKQTSPCIIFIDEIDAVAKKRDNSSYGGGNEERNNTLNQLLAEMDGFENTYGVIVMGATNRVDVLDEAILRPGRFDRKIVIAPPTLKEREQILKLHARNKPLNLDVNLNIVARKTSGLVGAELESILNEGAILAARHNKKSISNHDLDEAVERVIAGQERKSRIMSEKEKRIVAYHESGHALLAYLQEGVDPLHKISIVPRGEAALGYTMQLPEEDKHLQSKDELIKRIRILMGGRAAEDIILGKDDITGGCGSDIYKATQIAKGIVTKYGMSDTFGPIFLNDSSNGFTNVKDYSEATAVKIDNEILKILNENYTFAKNLLISNRDKLEKLAKALLIKEVIQGHEVEEIVDGKN